jgi:hypothetical protein
MSSSKVSGVKSEGDPQINFQTNPFNPAGSHLASNSRAHVTPESDPDAAPFADDTDFQSALADPRYRRDPTYRAEVEARLKVSMNGGQVDPGTVTEDKQATEKDLQTETPGATEALTDDDVADWADTVGQVEAALGGETAALAIIDVVVAGIGEDGSLPENLRAHLEDKLGGAENVTAVLKAGDEFIAKGILREGLEIGLSPAEINSAVEFFGEQPNSRNINYAKAWRNDCSGVKQALVNFKQGTGGGD